MSSPVPYRPPDAAPRKKLGGPRKDRARPWLDLLPYESDAAWHRRMSHTCWRCGHYDEDNKALDQHEETGH